MTRPRWFHCVLVLVVCLAVVPVATAQEPAPPPVTTADPPAHISFVDGTALLERDGRSDAELANMPLLAGDRVRTRGGRVEIVYGDGSTLHLDANTLVDFQSDDLVRLLEGRVRLSIPGARRAVSYRIDAPAAYAQIAEPGEYRVSLSNAGEIELAVIRGSAELGNESGRTALNAGERAFARPSTAPSFAYVFNSASWDAFDRWSESRREQRLGVSAQYLPDEVRGYSASFDRYGAWRHEPSYGYVWYPRVVAGWRPYYYGRWASFRPWGWTWIGRDPWAWPTHHYGRWGFSAGAWFWIPGRSWAPAWVSWAYAPGYVSWCPLGWNNRPVIQIVNVYRGYDPWHAWTVLPRRHFGYDYVHVRAASAGIMDARTRGSFVVRNSAPEISGYAVPRAGAPIRSAGTAVPRNGRPATVYTNNENSRMSPGSPRVMVGPDTRATTAPGARRADEPRASSGVARPRASAPAYQPGAPSAQGAGAAAAPDTYARPGLRAAPRNEAGDRYRGNAAEPYRRPPSDAYRVPGGVARERNAPAPPSGGYDARPSRGSEARPSGGNETRPSPGYGARDAYRPRPDDRRAPDSAPPSGGVRAVPRGGDYAPPARPGGGGGYERRPPAESRPSAPPSHAAPPQRSNPPPRAAEPGSRPRGDAPPSGGAARRRGGND